MRPVYDLLSGTAGSGKYFGKGSGGIENASAFIGTMYGEPLADNYGIIFDSKTGDIRFNDQFQEHYNEIMQTDEVTSAGFYDYLKKAFGSLTDSKGKYLYSNK